MNIWLPTDHPSVGSSNGRTDGRTDTPSYRVASSRLKRVHIWWAAILVPRPKAIFLFFMLLLVLLYLLFLLIILLVLSLPFLLLLFLLFRNI